MSLRERMEQIERGLLIDGLRESSGNKARAARELGLPLRTLVYRLTRLNVQRSDFND